MVEQAAKSPVMAWRVLGRGTAILAVVLLLLAITAAPVWRMGGDYADWQLAYLLRPQRLFVLVGMGFLFGQFSRKVVLPAIILLGAGGILGVAFREPLFGQLASIPGAVDNGFLMEPASGLLVGLALVIPRFLRPYLSLPLMLPAGAVLLLSTELSDISLHALSYMPLALLLQAALVAFVAFVVAQVQHRAIVIGGQILASWMIAIFLLYAGVMVTQKPQPVPPLAFPAAPGFGSYPGFDALLKQVDGMGERP